MADGSVIIDTKMDASGVESGANDISSSLNRIVSLLEKMSRSIDGVFSQMSSGADSAAQSTANLRKEIEDTVKAQDEWKPQDMSTLKISRGEEYAGKDDGEELTDDERKALAERAKEARKAANEEADAFNGVTKTVNELKQGYENAKAALKSLGAQGKFIGDKEWEDAYLNVERYRKEINETKKDILTQLQNPLSLDTISGKIQKAEQDLRDLERAGKSLGDADYDKAYQKLVALTAEAKEYKKNLAVSAILKEDNQELDQQNKKLSIAQNLVGKIKSTFSGIGKNLSSGAVKSSGKSMADGFGSALKTLLKYSVGIRSLFVLMNKLRSAAVEGFTNLAQYSSGTNSSISMLMSALTQLKNSFATAFNPILTVVAPILTTLINLLSKAATYVGTFFAALTGQKTFTKAIAVQQDYAKSLQNTSSSTKQAAKDTKKASKETDNYLSGLDEVQRYTSKQKSDSDGSSTPSSGGGYTAPSPSEMFETVPVENKFKDLANKIKKVFSEIFKPFKDAWKKEGEKTIEAAKSALNGLGTLAKSVGKSLLEVWTNGTGTKMLETMLRIAQNVLITIGNIASGFADAWNKNNVGTQIIQNIANALQVVLSFIERIAKDTADWAANLDFYPLLESISNLTATFAPILESIGNVLEWIYNNIVLPMLKWVIETGLPTVINLVSNLLGFFADHQSVVEAFGAALIGAFAAVKIAGLAKSIGGSITSIIGFGKGLVTLMTGSSGILGGVKAIATAIGAGGVFAIAIGAAIAIGVLLYKNWDKIKEVAGAVWKWISDKTVSFVNGIKTNLGNLATKISTIWGNIKTTASEKWNAIWTTVKEIVGKIVSGIVDKFTSAKDKVADIFGGIADTIKGILNKVIGIVNGAIGTVNSAIGGIESAFSFGPWKVPTPFGSKTIGFSASFPRVPTIPYLAKGAVIPPRSEFLAVLGDQKQGNNIETPEALLRKIVREETGGQQSGGGDYRFVAQINRRTVFDEIIEEAKLRQSTSGRNPFELA